MQRFVDYLPLCFVAFVLSIIVHDVLFRLAIFVALLKWIGVVG